MRRHLVTLAMLLAIGAIGPRASAAPILAFDINDRTEGETASDPSINTAPGFSPYTISSGTNSTGVVDGYTVNFDVFDDHDPVNDGGSTTTDSPGAFDDRDRVVPTTAPTLNQLYDDFIFVGNSAGLTGGVDLTISGGALLPNTPYFVSIYAYDGISASMGTNTPVRSAAWFDGNNLDAPVLTTTFTVNVPPVTDDQYKFTGIALTDAAGALFLKGRRVTAADVAVYVNGVEVNAIPEPASLGLAFATLAMIGVARLQRQH